MNIIHSEIKTILVADDDPAICAFLKDILKREDLEVVSTVRSVLTLKYLRKGSFLKFDLLITDLNMPEQGGYTLIKSLQSDIYSPIPVLVVTGKNLDQNTVDLICSEPNVKGLCKKPISVQDLLTKVRSALNSSSQ